MTTRWIDAAARADVPEDDVIEATVGERTVALYCVEGDVYATDHLCTHGNGRLCDGFLLGHEIECPLHQGRFDVRTGAPTCEPATIALRSYPVKVENGRVWVAVD